MTSPVGILQTNITCERAALSALPIIGIGYGFFVARNNLFCCNDNEDIIIEISTAALKSNVDKYIETAKKYDQFFINFKNHQNNLADWLISYNRILQIEKELKEIDKNFEEQAKLKKENKAQPQQNSYTITSSIVANRESLLTMNEISHEIHLHAMKTNALVLSLCQNQTIKDPKLPEAWIQELSNLRNLCEQDSKNQITEYKAKISLYPRSRILLSVASLTSSLLTLIGLIIGIASSIFTGTLALLALAVIAASVTLHSCLIHKYRQRLNLSK